MKKILVISFSKIHQDGRVLRQIKSLIEHNYSVTVIGFTNPNVDGVEFWQVSQNNLDIKTKFLFIILLKLRLYSFYSKIDYRYQNLSKIWESRINKRFDLIIGNDIETLFPTTYLAKNSIPVFFDAHEYFPEQKSGYLWKFIWHSYRDWLGKNYLPKVSKMCTVSENIRQEYISKYSVDSFLMPNAKEYYDLTPSSVEYDKIKLVHHGMAIRERGLHLLLQLIKLLDARFTLDLFLVEGDTGYWSEIEDEVSDLPKVTLHKGIPVAEIPVVLNQFDIGVHLIPPINFNQKNCLPNKYFEFIQARLALATGPTPDMKRLTEKYQIGLVSDNFHPSSLANMLNRKTSTEIYQLKKNTHKIARDLSFEKYSTKFIDEIKNIL